MIGGIVNKKGKMKEKRERERERERERGREKERKRRRERKRERERTKHAFDPPHHESRSRVSWADLTEAENLE